MFASTEWEAASVEDERAEESFRPLIPKRIELAPGEACCMVVGDEHGR